MLKNSAILFTIILSFLFFSCEGPTGQEGQNGIDGSQWYSGQGMPSNDLGVDGDYYLDTNSSVVYHRFAGEWTLHITISGKDGENGTAWHIGEGIPPGELGETGDFYLDYLNSFIYNKSINGWEFLVDIRGQDGGADKQIRLSIPSAMGTSKVEGWVKDEVDGLIKFNVYNYAGVDSVVLVAKLYSSETNTTCSVDLFNWTDSVFVSNSLVESNNIESKWIQSENLFSELPNREITLSIRIRSSVEGNHVSVSSAYLFLYR